MIAIQKFYLMMSAGALLSISLGALPAHSEDAAAKGTVHILVEPEPPMLMLGINQNQPTGTVAGQIYESLLRFDEKLNPMPSLAKSWEISPDGLTYVFHLQSGVKWHDGKPFTADDVVFSLGTFLPDTNPRWRPAFKHIKMIEKVDELTVKMTLKEPFAPMLLSQETASAPIIPKHIYEGTDYRTNPANNTPIGTGPFKFVEWKKGSFIHLTKNTDYWIPGKPQISDLYYEIIPDAAARAVAYETGKVDVMTPGSAEVYDVKRLSALPGSCVTTKGAELFALHGFITVNLRQGILANKQFRQGLSEAIDRTYLRDVVWNGQGNIPTGPVSSKTRFYSADTPKITFDLDKAKELIKASGYKGETIKLLALPYGEVYSRAAEAVKQNLIDAGVNVEIQTTDVPGWSQKMGNGDFDLGFTIFYQLGDPAIGVARSYISSNIVKGNPLGNTGGYANPEVDKLFADAAIATSDSERQALYTKMQQIVVDEMPALWYLELDMPTIYRCNIKNLITTATGVSNGFRDAAKE